MYEKRFDKCVKELIDDEHIYIINKDLVTTYDIYKTDELLYQNDQFSKELIFNEQSSVVVCHNDLIKDEFWNKEIVDFD